jgi:hypothetical protein
MGPIEVVIVTFPDAGMLPAVGPLLRDLVGSGHVRIADALIVTTGANGRMVVTDPDDDAIPAWSTISVNPQPLLSAEDAGLAAEELEEGGAAMLVVIEHTWPDLLGKLASDSGGQVSLHTRIDPETVAHAARVDA